MEGGGLLGAGFELKVVAVGVTDGMEVLEVVS